jgi:hypothetical protein
MGQEILYCFKCQTRLLGSDFERGKAFRVDAQAACPQCVRDLLVHLPDPDAEIERLKRTAVPKPSGTPSSSVKLPTVSTARIPAAPPRTADPSSPPSRMPLLIPAVVGGLIVAVVAFMFSGSKDNRPVSGAPSIPTPVPPPDPGPRPNPVNPIARDLEELDARLSAPLRQEKVQEAVQLLQAARGKHGSVDWTRAVDERMQKLEVLARRVAAPIFDQAGPAAKRKDQAALKDLRGRLEALGFPGLLGEYDALVAAAVTGTDPWTVLDFQSLKSEEGATLSKRADGSVHVSGPNPKRDTYVLTARVGLRGVRTFRLEALANPSLPSGGPGRAGHGNFVLTELKLQSNGLPLAFLGASATFEQDKYPASAAIDGRPLSGWAVNGKPGNAALFHLQAPADLDSVTIVLEQGSNHPGYNLGCFRISAGTAELPPPPAARVAEEFVPKTPETDEPSPAPTGYRARWAAAARPAAARDFAGAIKAVEELRAALTDEISRKKAAGDIADFKLAAEALAEVPRLLPKWTKGTKVDLQFIGETGLADRIEGTLLEAGARGVTIQAEGGTFDVPAGELAAGSIATLLALRGEKKPTDARAVEVLRALEGASGGDMGARFSDVRGALDPKESEARRLFWSAEEDFSTMKTRGAAAAVYEKLLADATFFAARNKAFLEERVVASREQFFFADDLAAGGTFSLASAPKLETYWISAADSPGKAAANFVEAELFVAPGAACRAWIFAGGCCQEVFTFYLQGTGLSGPSAKNPRETVAAAPGGEDMIVVRVPTGTLKKKHADHTGPKEPDRWMWIDLGALKFADAGPKRLRILTEQKGLGVAYLAVGPSRQGAPREAEVKELLKNRPPQGYQATGTILREIFRGSGETVGDLTSMAKFKEGKPDQSGTIAIFDSGNLGNEYGCRIRGYVHPPATGEYVFWLASDDHGELWLSADDSPERKQRICHLNHPVGHQAWNSDPTQKSAGMSLVGGRRYYIEVLQKQGGGGEHVAVGWTLPGGVQERPIPGSRLSPIGAVATRKATRPGFGRGFSPEGAVTRSACIGGSGGRDFELAPTPRQLLRGLHLRVSSGYVGSVKPVFQGPAGDVDGALAGEGNAKTEVIGRPGYVVGGVVLRATDRVNSMKVIFVRVSGNRLLAGDRYETEWFGSRPGGTETMLGDGVTPVVGVFGRQGSWIDALGLVLQGK